MQAPAGKRFSLRQRIRSFGFAFKGIARVFGSQHNFRIHVAVFALVVFAGFFFGISLLFNGSSLLALGLSAPKESAA